MKLSFKKITVIGVTLTLSCLLLAGCDGNSINIKQEKPYQISMLTKNQVQSLTSKQLGELTPQQFEHLTKVYLTNQQLASAGYKKAKARDDKWAMHILKPLNE